MLVVFSMKWPISLLRLVVFLMLIPNAMGPTNMARSPNDSLHFLNFHFDLPAASQCTHESLKWWKT